MDYFPGPPICPRQAWAEGDSDEGLGHWPMTKMVAFMMDSGGGQGGHKTTT